MSFTYKLFEVQISDLYSKIHNLNIIAFDLSRSVSMVSSDPLCETKLFELRTQLNKVNEDLADLLRSIDYAKDEAAKKKD